MFSVNSIGFINDVRHFCWTNCLDNLNFTTTKHNTITFDKELSIIKNHINGIFCLFCLHVNIIIDLNLKIDFIFFLFTIQLLSMANLNGKKKAIFAGISIILIFATKRLISGKYTILTWSSFFDFSTYAIYSDPISVFTFKYEFELLYTEYITVLRIAFCVLVVLICFSVAIILVYILRFITLNEEKKLTGQKSKADKLIQTV